MQDTGRKRIQRDFGLAALDLLLLDLLRPEWRCELQGLLFRVLSFQSAMKVFLFFFNIHSFLLSKVFASVKASEVVCVV